MDAKKFKMIDEAFICENCNTLVQPLKKSARNHCNKCLFSKHVDINPGDRACKCLGLLEPIGIEKAKKDNYKIIYRCKKCHEIKKNIMAFDDDFDQILKIASNSANKNM